MPVQYPFGCAHPPGSVDFALKYGISLSESWQEFFAKHHADGAQLQATFESLAGCVVGDAKCTIGVEGVKKLIRTFFDGVEPTPERIQKVLDACDLNNDKQISWEEFQRGARALKPEYDASTSALDHQ